MVQVIERLEDAGVIRFRVHRSSRDQDLIVGSWQHAVDEHGMGSIWQNQLGASVDIEYQCVLHVAAQCGVPFV